MYIKINTASTLCEVYYYYSFYFKEKDYMIMPLINEENQWYVGGDSQ